MTRAKAAVARRSDPKETLEREGNLMRAKFSAEHEAAVKAAARLSKCTVGHLRAKPAEEQAAFVKGMVEGGRVFFQPWAMEILFVLGLLNRARFTELQRLTGASSRTLSDKLQELREIGLVTREVFDEQPVRIEYYLTARGTRVAMLGSPLFCELESRTPG